MATDTRTVGATSPATGRTTAYASDRTPPHHLEAEVAVLGSALLSRSATAEVVDLLRPEDFYRSVHRTVFEAIVDLYSRGEAIDEITLLDRLDRTGKLDEIGGGSAIHDLVAAVPTAANAVFYARIVADKALLRRVIDAGTRVVQLGFEGGEDVHDVVDRAEQVVYEVGSRRQSAEFHLLKDLLNESVERIEKLSEQRSEVTGLPTGLDDLDRLTAGLQPQNLVIVAARPSMGKSSLALGIAHYVTSKVGKPVVFFSLEMSWMEIVQRLIAFEAGIPSNKLRTGRLDDLDWQKLADALGGLAEAPLFIHDAGAVTMLEIRSICRRLKQRHDLGLVIVDYLQLMQSHKRTENRQQEVSEISRGLKMLAKELDVPVMALSQLNRLAEGRSDKRPQLADLRESGALEQDADIVAFVYREEMYDPDTVRKGIAELIISKHRNGPTGSVELAFRRELAQFANLTRAMPPPA